MLAEIYGNICSNYFEQGQRMKRVMFISILGGLKWILRR